LFSLKVKVTGIEVYKADPGRWAPVLSEPKELDLVKISGIEEVLGQSRLEAGRYTQVRFQVEDASVVLGSSSFRASIPSREVRLVGTFEVEAGKTTVLTLDFDVGASLKITAKDQAVFAPAVKLSTTEPQSTPPSLRLSAVTVSGLLATAPEYLRIDLTEFSRIANLVYPGKVPRSLQVFLLLTEDDQAYLVLGLDKTIDRYITAGTVRGFRAPSLKAIPNELDFAGRIIVSDDIVQLEPLRATPGQVNADGKGYAFKRVVMDTTYIFASARIKAQQVTRRMGFAFASDAFGKSANLDDYLAVLDPYNTETQIRVANVIGTVLFPTEAMRRFLGEVYKFSPQEVGEILERPTVFYEALQDDEAQLLNIDQLYPTYKDPTLKLHKFHGEMLAVKGIALGHMVRTEDIPQLRNSPVHITSKVIGVADLTGAMPLIGISSEDVSGEVFGHYRFEVSVYVFEGQKAHAFLISKKAVALDPIAEVERASFGNRVKSRLANYSELKAPSIKVAADLTLEQVDLLLPSKAGDPLILTRHPQLASGDFLKSVSFDGYLIDGRFLGISSDLIARYGPRVLVVNQSGISFEKGPVPTPTPPAAPTPTPVPTPAPPPRPPGY
jgi:hypothetical protein